MPYWPLVFVAGWLVAEWQQDERAKERAEGEGMIERSYEAITF